MAYSVRDTQQVYIGYEENSSLNAVGNYKVISKDGVYAQFVNAKKEVTRTDIIKPESVTYLKAKKGSDLNDTLYGYEVDLTGITVIPGASYSVNIVVPDTITSNTGAMWTYNGTHVAKTGDTAVTIAKGIINSLKNHFYGNEDMEEKYGHIYKVMDLAALDMTTSATNEEWTELASFTDSGKIFIGEVFFKEIFSLGVTPVVNLLKRLKVTINPVWDEVAGVYITDWAKVTKSSNTLEVKNHILKLQEQEWFLNTYKSSSLPHKNDKYYFMSPFPKQLITEDPTKEWCTLDVHYEELGDGSILSQKNILFIGPKGMVNKLGDEISKMNTKVSFDPLS